MIIAILAITGLCFGSFVNAFVWRLKKKKNWISERSICSHCRHVLAPKDLVPVISWTVLRGRCRYCSKKIEDNPITEILTALLFVGSYIFWPAGLDAQGLFMFIIWLVAIVLLVSMFLYDLKWMILPDKLTFGLLGLAVVQVLVLFAWNGFDFIILRSAIFSLAVGGIIFHLLYIFSNGKYIGGGDVKLGYAYGLLLLDPIKPWLTLTVASIIGSVVSAVLLLTKRAKMGTKLPFGPLLITGLIIVMLWGDRLWDYIGQLWY